MTLCDYGCGKEATHQFKNGKNCCSSNYTKCDIFRNKMKGEGNPFYNHTHTEESRNMVSLKNKNKIPWNKDIPRTDEEKKNISIKTREGMSTPEIKKKVKENRPDFKKEKHPNWRGGYYERKLVPYDFFMPRLSPIEECRRNEEDKNILEVKCTYCGKWYCPTPNQVYERIRCMNGSGGGRFYCSELCKSECSIFNQTSYPKDFKPATSREVQAELRQMRFVIDNYTCQKCKKHQDELSTGLHCHHREGIRWEPIESADLDMVITLCKLCHIEVHKKEGCGYHDMGCGK